MTHFRHIHASLLWKVALDRLTRDLDFYRERADLLTTTETGKRSKKRAFRAPGWAFFRPSGSSAKRETTVSWRTDVFERAGDARAVRISSTRWTRKNGKRSRRSFASVVPLRHRKTGRTVFVLAAHLPSSVDSANGFRRGVPLREQAHQECAGALADLVDEIRAEHPYAAIVLAADWNLDHRKRWVRRHLRGVLGLRSTWQGRLPKKGTHGPRVIDATYAWNLRVKRQVVLRKRASDHRAYRTAFRFTRLPQEHPER